MTTRVACPLHGAQAPTKVSQVRRCPSEKKDLRYFSPALQSRFHERRETQGVASVQVNASVAFVDKMGNYLRVTGLRGEVERCVSVSVRFVYIGARQPRENFYHSLERVSARIA